MGKLLFKIFLFILIVAVLVIIFLSFVGLETDKFDNLIKSKANEVNQNIKLGFKMDQRDYGTGALILRDLGITNMNLLTNNPSKRAGLEGFGLNITKRTPLIGKTTPENTTYLDTKKDKMGHNFNEE